MKKVLIYFEEDKILPKGGPGGYLFNLRSGLNNVKSENFIFDFLPSRHSKSMNYIINRIPKKLKPAYTDWRIHKMALFLGSDEKKTSPYDLDRYDIIHFHSIFSLISAKDSIKDYNGIVLLTSHTPKPPHLEYIEDVISKNEYRRHKADFDRLAEVEEEAFSIADYIIFPCEEAEEPYSNNWNDYKRVKAENKNKYRYLQTGIAAPKIAMKRKDITSQYGIPEDAIIISYVGRHNETKGYDKLLKIGEQILRKYNNVYFLVAGKEEPLNGLRSERWHEVGWTDQPTSIISAADIFILPNKETYFDIVMLETLACATCVVASKTGGNRFFSTLPDDKSILLYENVDEAVKLLSELIDLGHEKLSRMGQINSELYKKYFTNDIFAKGYINLLSSLCN